MSLLKKLSDEDVVEGQIVAIRIGLEDPDSTFITGWFGIADNKFKAYPYYVTEKILRSRRHRIGDTVRIFDRDEKDVYHRIEVIKRWPKK